jgi:hypothetical protein
LVFLRIHRIGTRGVQLALLICGLRSCYRFQLIEALFDILAQALRCELAFFPTGFSSSPDLAESVRILFSPWRHHHASVGYPVDASRCSVYSASTLFIGYFRSAHRINQNVVAVQDETVAPCEIRVRTSEAAYGYARWAR